MRFYLTPMAGDGSATNPNRGKYIHVQFKGVLHKGIVKSSSNVMAFGAERVCLMGAKVTPEEHTQLMAQSDVFAFPHEDNLDKPITDASAIEACLNAYNIPSAWVRNGMSYREALRRISGMFQLMQNMNGQLVRFGHLDAPFGMETKAQHFKHAPVMGTLRDALEKTGEEFQATKFVMKTEV